MPYLTPAAADAQIDAGEVAAVYLLQGEDDVAKSALASKIEETVEEGLRAFNVERVYAADMTSGDRIVEGVDSVLNALRTLPMMAPRRVVTVFQAENILAPRRESEAAARALEQLEAYLDRPDPLATLVLVATPLDRRTRMARLITRVAVVVDCGAPEDAAAATRWIQARVQQGASRIDGAAARAMAVAAGFPDRPSKDGRTGDVKRLRNEVDRLLLYTLGQKSISLDDVRAVVGPATLQDDWAMANAIESARPGEALRQLALMLDAGAPAEKILGQLGYVVRAKFPVVAPQRVTPAVEALFRTDLDLKRSTGDPRILLERLVVELCGGRGKLQT